MASDSKYTQGDADADGAPRKVSADAGRKCVRSIQQHPVLSPLWMQLVESLRQLVRLVQLEGRMPADAKVTELAGRNTESEGTLWDQAVNENAIRILVEEAKVTLCIRIMNDFKKWQYDPSQTEATIAIASGEFSHTQITAKCVQFEESLGQLLRRSFMHVETLQLIDVPLLIEHCGLVLHHCSEVKDKPFESGACQELVVISYVASLFKHCEALSSGEPLAKARDFNLLPLTVEHVLAHVAEYPNELCDELASGLAALCDNEDFQTDWQQFFESPSGQPSVRDAMATFLQLKTVLVDPILAANPDKKRNLRPLLDFFNTVTRKCR